MRTMNKTIWKQTDSRWGKKPYPGRGYTVGGCGCGLVACVHVAMEQERYKNWTPNNLRGWMVGQGFAVCGQGTRWEGITSTLKHIGHSKVVRIYDDPMSEAFKELNKGNRIGIILFKSNKAPNGIQWTSNGHYVAFTDYKVQDKKHYFYCKDSGGRNHDGWYTYENSMKGCVYKVWIVERVGAQVKTPVIKASTYKPTSAYKGTLPKGTVKKGTKGADAKAVQTFLNWCINAKLKADGISGSATVAAIKVYQKTYGLSADGMFGPASKKKAQDIIKKYTPATEVQIPPSTVAKPKPKTKGNKISDCAVEYAYSGNPKEAQYKGGKPKASYKKALSKAYPSHTNWGPGPKQGASCDVFVGTCVRNAGVAKKYPRGLAEQEKYLEKHFTRVKYSGDRKVLKDGDIGVMQYGSSGHTFIVVIKNGKLKICEANLRDTYPITVTSKSGLEWRLKKRSGRDYVHIFRAK